MVLVHGSNVSASGFVNHTIASSLVKVAPGKLTDSLASPPCKKGKLIARFLSNLVLIFCSFHFPFVVV